ncbi:MAG: hypothetical protein JXA30_19455 [Deltaproteobacteria bacterium]|nr:hypothetical protein [Deltaproteobacteria bacterium]
MRFILLAFVLFAHACLLDNISPTRKLNDSIRDMNDASRWGRIDLASQYVDPAYQTTFFKSRHRWGRQFRIADTELVRLDMSPDQDQAIALMSISWYRIDQMTLHQTVVRQIWKERDGTYLLSAEAVFEGDAILIQGPPKPSADSGGPTAGKAPAS